jgi:hypothetical protein
MNLERIIAELRNEVDSINEAIAALQRLLPADSEHREEPLKAPKKSST